MKERLLESYQKCILQINENKLNKKAKIVELVIEYIRKNYENPCRDLTLHGFCSSSLKEGKITFSTSRIKRNLYSLTG